MNKNLFSTLLSWPKGYITDTDLAAIIDRTPAVRYGLVNRALKEGLLTHIRRGVYQISETHFKKKIDVYELAQVIYGPSFISLESSLQYHNLIPEEVFTITSVTTNRSKEFSTPIGLFTYEKIPEKNFLLGVERKADEHSCFYMAKPWRSIADFIYLKDKDWVSPEHMRADLRIEDDDFVNQFDRYLLHSLSENYPHQKTREKLKILYRK